MSNRKILATCGMAALSSALVLGVAPQAEAVGTVRAVTAIGDSYPSGAMGNEGNSYVERYGRATGQRALNWSYSGWKTGDVLYQMRTNPAEIRNLRDARTVIVTIGANDISESYDPSAAAKTLYSYNPALRAMRSRLHSILYTISRARGGHNSRVVVTDYNQIYTDGSALARHGWSYRVGSENLTKAVNSVIMSECRSFGMACVDVYPTFQRSRVDYYLIPDGTHPNSNGHQVYANLIRSKVGA